MPSKRKKLRVLVLVEDARTRRFFRKLLAALGFETREAKQQLRIEAAPSGEGSGETWVRRRYPGEVRVLRTKRYQKNLRLVAVRDADGVGLARRKQELDDELMCVGLAVRHPDEKIATPVPARNLETWLLALLGASNLNETEDYKDRFRSEHRTDEDDALRRAASAWNGNDGTSLPSLRDGKTEMERVCE